MKNLFSIICLLTVNLLFAQADPDPKFPDYYSPLNNIRNIEVNPSVLLKVTGQYGVWYKTNF